MGREYLRSGRASVRGTRGAWLPSPLLDWRVVEGAALYILVGPIAGLLVLKSKPMKLDLGRCPAVNDCALSRGA